MEKNLNILIPAVPRHLRLSQDMIEDFLINPVLAAETIFRVKLDEFQKARLKLCWWTPRVMDSSGLSSAKTFGMWIVSNLRCILMSNHVSAVYYQNWGTGQKVYWKYFDMVASRAPIFAAQVGKRTQVGLSSVSGKDGKAENKGPNCWTCVYRNGSQLLLPAGDFLRGAKGQAGQRFHDLNIDEWTKIEAMVGEDGADGISDQLIGRTSLETFNQHHPIWGNHHLFLATAQDTMHPAYERYLAYLKQVRQGNPEYALLSYSFKEYSTLPYVEAKTFREALRDERMIRDMRLHKSKAGYLQEALGVWSKTGTGWYTKEIIDACLSTGEERGTEILCGRSEDWAPEEKKNDVFYFLGVDPAPAANKKSDDGALVTLRAQPLCEDAGCEIRNFRLDFVWAYKVRKADATQWSGLIHRKHGHFRYSVIQLDPGGGGEWIRSELKKPVQTIREEQVRVRPIACREDEATLPITSDFILSMFNPMDSRIEAVWGNFSFRTKENINDNAHSEFLEALQLGIVGLPRPYRTRRPEEVASWPGEKMWANRLLDLMGTQLTAISVATNEKGEVHRTKNGARQFGAKGKKDFAYAGLYAFVGFLTWLKQRGDDGMAMRDEDADMVF